MPPIELASPSDWHPSLRHIRAAGPAPYITQVFWDSNAPLAAKLGIALSLLGGIGTNFSLLSAGYTIAIAVLFGLSTAMIAYLVKQRRIASAGKSIAIGSGAAVSGVLGVGCAACGSLILGVVLPSIGAAGALAALPLNGEEFGLLSVALLFVSPLCISKDIAQSNACSLAQTRNAQQLRADQP